MYVNRLVRDENGGLSAVDMAEASREIRSELMNSTAVSTAIMQALVQGGSQWVISTIVAFLPALWTMSLILHLGRPYVLRTLPRIGLRLGPDVCWMSYLLIRDAVLLITFGLSFIFFNPNIVVNSALPITGPISALLLLLALAVKLSRRVGGDGEAFRVPTRCLVLGVTPLLVPPSLSGS